MFFYFFCNISMSDLLLDKLKQVAKSLLLDELKLLAEYRRIKGSKSMSKKRLLSVLSKPKLIKNNFDNERLKKIREDLNKSRHKFSKSEIKDIRKNFFKIESKKNSFNAKNKRD